MIFSYSQISNYLGCPRRYRYRYFDGWEEKANRASMLFGRIFEQALCAHFRGEPATEIFGELWGPYRETELEYGSGDCWQKCLDDGFQFLEIFASQERIQITEPVKHLQPKFQKRLGPKDEFIAYVDAIGSLDGISPTIIDWKTTSSSYPSSPDGIVSLDQQLIAYSWITGIANVALVVFVRKKKPEIQYLRASISDTQRSDYARLVDATIANVRRARFEPQPGIRFPQSGCLSCDYVGLCLGRQEIVQSRLSRKSNLVWIDELAM